MRNDSESPRISVVIPVYGNRQLLERCLRALANQTFPKSKFEIIIVDNSPSSVSKNLEKSLRVPDHDQGPTIRIFSETRIGSYAARNCGIRESRGEIIAFTDDDCIPAPNWLEEAERLSTPSTILAGRIRLFSENRSENLIQKYDKLYGLKQRRFVLQQHFGATANLVVPKTLFETFGLFDDRLYSSGDQEWCARSVKAGAKIQYAPSVLVNHPTLATYSDLLRKRRRIAGGRDRLRSLGLNHIHEEPYRGFKNSKLLRKALVLTSFKAAQILILHIALRMIQKLEVWRCRLGGTPERL